MKTGFLHVQVVVSFALAFVCSLTPTSAGHGNPARDGGSISIKTDPRAVISAPSTARARN